MRPVWPTSPDPEPASSVNGFPVPLGVEDCEGGRAYTSGREQLAHARDEGRIPTSSVASNSGPVVMGISGLPDFGVASLISKCSPVGETLNLPTSTLVGSRRGGDQLAPCLMRTRSPVVTADEFREGGLEFVKVSSLDEDEEDTESEDVEGLGTTSTTSCFGSDC